MELLKEVANVSGQSGLYRILKPTRTGVIVESLDGKKARSVVGANARVSVLKDISVYMANHQDNAIPLGDIFMAIKEKHGNKVEIAVKTASDAELFDFLDSVAPDFDREKVYASDVKKMINWFNILSVNMPEAFEKTVEPDTVEPDIEPNIEMEKTEEA